MIRWMMDLDPEGGRVRFRSYIADLLFLVSLDFSQTSVRTLISWRA